MHLNWEAFGSMFSYKFSIWGSYHTDRPEKWNPVLIEIKSRNNSKEKLNTVSLPHASAQVEKKTQTQNIPEKSVSPRESV